VGQPGDVLDAIFPADAGVATPELDITEVEGARLLANEARAELKARGFTDDEVREWAEAYYAQHHEGDVRELVAWIAEREGHGVTRR